ncbi:endoplasmic reticulum metallopeptidase 1 [Latimeria chalumnae]|uniref:Endoplasmic reticulum metallopeptidase 1 n=1 Tax=Latimeria chalumnae TaxID=7897 RepID=H3AP99_LATCH|nr:PREDICTED: endoplasmic reticulum metallopeptidase 1 [Latimeria chalumnae]|eukprot:XP_006004697.1 PREDICTED: endoplasmic reticulum metallopeptidase 1 [Latimeria chalumnae]
MQSPTFPRSFPYFTPGNDQHGDVKSCSFRAQLTCNDIITSPPFSRSGNNSSFGLRCYPSSVVPSLPARCLERKMESELAQRRLRGRSNLNREATDLCGNDGDSTVKKKKHATVAATVPCLLAEGSTLLVLVLYLLALRVLVQVSLQQLVLGSASGDFSALTARKHLEHITGIGPRTAGSPANEVLTVNYLLEQIQMIAAESSEAHKISAEVQRPTGSFSIDFLGGFTSYYDRITNVVVKLEPRDGAKHAVLANCHFDSVFNSPGASDDAVSCSIMLEVLHALAKSSMSLQHAVIFLFNGAEENVLQASHGFITQHRWAKMVRAFINLEAAGVGGKELVFQTGPENPWLVQAYVLAAKHPFASVVGQEIFQSGVIPSDTDFRIYRDFGNIPGIDLAFIENGYIYHTKYDTSDRILTDSIQRAGDNVLAVLKYLAISDKLADSSEYRHGNMVFFDFYGFFVVAYPARVGAIINYMVAAFAVIYLGKKFSQPKGTGSGYMRDLIYAVGVTLMSWFITLVSVLIVAVFVSLIGRSMSWYSHFYVSVCLYGTAALAKLILIHTLAKNVYYGNMNQKYLGELYFDVVLTVWCSGLVFLTQQGICSAYVTMLWVAFPLITKLLVHAEFKERGATVKFTVLYLLGMFFPFLHTMYLFWTAFEMFTPLLGRSGTEIPPDVVMASIIVGYTIVLSSYFVNFVYLSKSTKRLLLALGSVFVITSVLVSSGVFFPYSSELASPKPKRVFLQHSTRTFHGLNGNVIKRDSGIWINGLDYTGMSHVTPYIPEINDSIRSSCEKAPFCGHPWILPIHFLIRKNWYLPAPEVSPKTHVHFKLLSKEKTPWDTTKLTFEVTGPTHMSLYVHPHEGSTLSSWSFGDGTPMYSSNGDYFILYSHGLEAPAWQFWLELQVAEVPTDGIITVAIAAHYLFGEDQQTPQLDALLQRFPDWAVPSSWVSTYDLFTF